MRELRQGATSRFPSSLILALFLTSCSLVFDTNAEDVQVIDARAGFDDAFRLPVGFSSVFSTVLPLKFYQDEPLRERSLFERPEQQGPIIEGVDGQMYWPAFSPALGGPRRHVFFRVPPPPPSSTAESALDVSGYFLSYFVPPNFVFVRRPSPPTRPGSVVWFTAGERPVEETIPVAHGDNTYSVDTSVLSCDPAAKPPTIQLIRRHPTLGLERLSFERPVEADAKAGICGNVFYDATADVLYFHSENEHQWLRPFSTGVSVDLGEVTLLKMLPELIIYENKEQALHAYSLPLRMSIPLGATLTGELRRLIYADPQWLLTCGEGGLQSVELASLRTHPMAKVHLLDSRACGNIWRLEDGQVIYESSVVIADWTDEAVLRQQRVQFRVPLDGSAPPQIVESRERLGQPPFGLARCENGVRAYALNQGAGATSYKSDAWIDGWRFSTDASEVSFSSDCRRVRWKEHASRDGVGELFSAILHSGSRLRLGRNVGHSFELPDGRLLAQTNLIGAGASRHLMLIDEEARTAHWLVDDTQQVYAAQFVPKLQRLIVALIAKPSAARADQYVLLPLPPRH